MKLFENDFRYEVREFYIPEFAKLISEELTDRELFELTKELFNKMDSTYKHQFLDECM